MKIRAYLSILAAVLLAPVSSQAVVLNVDTYLEGDASIIPFFPVGTIELTDTAPDTVRFDLVPNIGVKFDNLALGLDASIDETDLVLTPITPDQITLALGGFLGFPFVINFNDKPMTPVSFTLSAPGLDLTDFLHLPASHIYPNTNFALRFWYAVPGVPASAGPIDATGGNNPGVPEPATVLMLGGALFVASRFRRAA